MVTVCSLGIYSIENHCLSYLFQRQSTQIFMKDYPEICTFEATTFVENVIKNNWNWYRWSWFFSRVSCLTGDCCIRNDKKI